MGLSAERKGVLRSVEVVEGVLRQAAWWRLAGREQRPADKRGWSREPWARIALSPALAGFSACPVCCLGEGGGWGTPIAVVTSCEILSSKYWKPCWVPL